MSDTNSPQNSAEREPVESLNDRYESSELTSEQSAELRAGRLPGELKLEAIQTIGVIIALVMALVAVILSMTAMSKASNAEETARESVAIVKTVDSEHADRGGKIKDLIKDVQDQKSETDKGPLTKDTGDTEGDR